MPDSFEGMGPGRALGAVFQNPARLAGAKSHQLKVETASDYLGYDRFTLAYLYGFSKARIPFALAVGHYAFYADDLIRTTESEHAPNGVAIGGSFSDKNAQSVAAMGALLGRGFSAGTTVRYYTRNLDSASKQSVALDFGVLWQYRFLQLGAYTRNLFATDPKWNTTDTQEMLPEALVAEIGLSWKQVNTLLSSDFDRHRLWGEYQLNPHLSLIGDGVWESGGGLIRHGIGALLTLGGVSLQYQHLQFDASHLSFSQDTLGLALQLSPEKWSGHDVPR